MLVGSKDNQELAEMGIARHRPRTYCAKNNGDGVPKLVGPEIVWRALDLLPHLLNQQLCGPGKGPDGTLTSELALYVEKLVVDARHFISGPGTFVLCSDNVRRLCPPDAGAIVSVDADARKFDSQHEDTWESFHVVPVVAQPLGTCPFTPLTI